MSRSVHSLGSSRRRWLLSVAVIVLIVVGFGVLFVGPCGSQRGAYGSQSFDHFVATSLSAPDPETGARTVRADDAVVLVLGENTLAFAVAEEVQRLLVSAVPGLEVSLVRVAENSYGTEDGEPLADFIAVVDVAFDETSARVLRRRRSARIHILAGRSPFRNQDSVGTPLWCTHLEVAGTIHVESGSLFGWSVSDGSIARTFGTHWKEGLEDLDFVAPPPASGELGDEAALSIPIDLDGDTQLIYSGRRTDGSAEAAWILDVEESHTEAYEAILARAEDDGWERTGGSGRPDGRPNALVLERELESLHVDFARSPTVSREDPATPDRFALTLRRAP